MAATRKQKKTNGSARTAGGRKVEDSTSPTIKIVFPTDIGHRVVKPSPVKGTFKEAQYIEAVKSASGKGNVLGRSVTIQKADLERGRKIRIVHAMKP